MVPCGTMVIKENSNLFLQLLSFNPNHARIYILLYSMWPHIYVHRLTNYQNRYLQLSATAPSSPPAHGLWW